MRRSLGLLIGMIGIALLAGCGGNPAAAQYKQNPRGFMRQVVRCENKYAAIGQTSQCQQALRLNARLFGAP